MNDAAQRTQTHSTFVLERIFPAPPARVWAAYADEETKKRWFGAEDESWTITEYVHDFRVGGRDVNEGVFDGGMRSRYVSTYTDIVEEERIVLTYDMWVDGRHISTSVQTLAFAASGDSTALTLTEQAVHLDGIDTPAEREEGTAELLEALAASLG